MTRLTSADLLGLIDEMNNLDISLRAKTGLSLGEIGAFAAGIDEGMFNSARNRQSVGIIPITAGEGLIGGFAESVLAIITFLGFDAFITNHSDVAGIAEAVERGAKIIFMADDYRFIALNLKTGHLIDNSIATGRGYVAALNAMAKGLFNKKLLIVGAGEVGTSASNFARDLGALISVYDPNPNQTDILLTQLEVTIEPELKQALPRYELILDACPQAGIMDSVDLQPDTIIAAPGVPLGLTEEAQKLFGSRLIHDPLQLGVATMLAMAVT